MKIGIANDHRGVDLKAKIIEYLKKNNIEYVNYGTDTNESVDYVDYAVKLCNGINNHEVDLGILVCGTGIGMSIAANKVKNILAAKVNNRNEAALCREHNRANVMTLAEYTEDLEGILDNFINTKPSEEEKHIRRVNKILNI
jgi:ribose 5-phosphate isomerase B